MSERDDERMALDKAVELAERFTLGEGAAQNIVDVARAAVAKCSATRVADVVALDAYRLVPDPAVVEACRELLAMAESGELRAIQWGGSLSEGRTRARVVGWGGEVIEMLGASTMLRMHVEALALEAMTEV